MERWKFCLDKQGFAGTLLNFYFYFIVDLSKVFDRINYELLIAKLHAYGFSTDALEVLLSNLQDRWQRVKINTTFSSFKEFHKDHFLVVYCLTFTSKIYFSH